MKPETYRALAAYEDRFWWHRARRAMVARLLHRHGLGAGARVLDVGCGTGGSFALFDAAGAGCSVGFDYAWDAVSVARSKHPRALVLQADASKPLPFAPGSFDLVTVFGVLNHSWIDDETSVLRRIAGLLREGGLLAMTEPSFPILTRQMDRLGMTRRRYRAAELSAMAREAGFERLYDGYFAFLAFLPALGVALVDRLRRAPADGAEEPVSLDFRMPAAWLNRLFLALTNLEGRAIAAGWRFPVGVTFIGVYRKAAGDASALRHQQHAGHDGAAADQAPDGDRLAELP